MTLTFELDVVEWWNGANVNQHVKYLVTYFKCYCQETDTDTHIHRGPIALPVSL